MGWEGGDSPYAPTHNTVWRLADVLNGEPVFVKDGEETGNNGALGYYPNFNQGSSLANYCAGQTWDAVVLDKFPDYSFIVGGTWNWGVAGSCTGTETADILEVLRGQRDSITTAFRARTNSYHAAHRDVKIKVVRDVMECGGRFYSDALFSKTESEQCAIMEAVLPKRDVCTLGTMTAGGRGERSALLDKKYFKFDDQTAYDDYASAGSQYWHNGLGRTTYVSQTSSWPEGCMNACCANPACQSFMFYKSECTLYSVATAAGMDDILGHESRQGPWGISTGGPGYSIGFWEMSRKPVTNVLAPSGAHDVFCNGARGMKELARFPDLGSCYNAAKVDSDCDITHGVAYAVQANDPTDTWRADRCTCVRKTCNGPWHATDRIFARYGDPFLECTVKYTRHRGMIRQGNWVLTDDDLIPTDPVCVTNDDWTPPFCRNGKFPQGLAIGIDRCKVACAARPKCKGIGIG